MESREKWVFLDLRVTRAQKEIWDQSEAVDLEDKEEKLDPLVHLARKDPLVSWEEEDPKERMEHPE